MKPNQTFCCDKCSWTKSGMCLKESCECHCPDNMETCYDCQDNCIDPKLCSCKCHSSKDKTEGEKCRCECHNSNWKSCSMCETHHRPDLESKITEILNEFQMYIETSIDLTTETKGLDFYSAKNKLMELIKTNGK